MKLSTVIDQLVEERGLGRDILEAIVIEGMLSAYDFFEYTMSDFQ